MECARGGSGGERLQCVWARPSLLGVGGRLLYYTPILCVLCVRHTLYYYSICSWAEWPQPVCQGSKPCWSLLYGHTWLETPDPVRSPKLSNHGRV